MSKDLRGFIRTLEQEAPNLLVRIRKEVDVKYEMPALINKLGGGLADSLGTIATPALLFENVKGYDMPVITNIFGTRRLAAIALGVNEHSLSESFHSAERHPIEPKKVESGPVKDVIMRGDDVDLTRFPIVTHCEKDIGAFINAGVMLTKDPASGYINVGLYRHMFKGKAKLGASFAPQSHGAHIFRDKESRGEDLECAIVLGHHPMLALASQFWGSFGVPELSIAGALQGEPLEMLRAETVDLDVPADSEIVIEGKVKAGSGEVDAPFGEYLGYYGDETMKRPIMEVTAITHRKDPIYHDLHNGGVEHTLLSSIGKEAELFKRVVMSVPQVTDVRLPMSGCGHLAYVRLKKGYEGSGKNAALAALTINSIKMSLVVDDDIDIDDDSKVIWALVTRTDPDRSFFYIPEASVARLDPMSYTLKSRSEKGTLSTKLGIDATMPLGTHFPEIARPPKDIIDNIDLTEYIKEETVS